LNLPRSFAGHGQLWRYIHHIECSDCEIAAADDPWVRTVSAAPGARVHISYLVGSSIEGEPTAESEQPYAPWILPSWFYIGGEAVFAWPDEVRSNSADFHWKGPTDYKFASTLDPSAHAPGASLTVSDVRKSTLMGGRDIRIAKDGRIRLAIHGEFQLSDGELLKAVATIVRIERRFWGDLEDAPFLVTLASIAPTGQAPGAMSGNAKQRGFAMAMTPNMPLERVERFLAHETFHNWNRRKLGMRAGGATSKKADESDAWFIEGFADYYSRLFLYRSGLVELKDFVRDWNEQLIEYAQSPAKAATNAEIGDNFFKNPTFERMAYLRGEIVAAKIDRTLRNLPSNPTSLDEVLRKQRAIAATNPDKGAVELFEELVLKAAPGLSSVFSQNVANGSPMKWPPNLFGSCIIVSDVDLPSFDRGFDAAATAAADMVVSGVEKDGPAYAGGLREGMRLLKHISGSAGDPTTDYAWEVELPSGQRKTIRWKPVGDGALHAQRLAEISGAPVAASSCGLGASE